MEFLVSAATAAGPLIVDSELRFEIADCRGLLDGGIGFNDPVNFEFTRKVAIPVEVILQELIFKPHFSHFALRWAIISESRDTGLKPGFVITSGSNSRLRHRDVGKLWLSHLGCKSFGVKKFTGPISNIRSVNGPA